MSGTTERPGFRVCVFGAGAIGVHLAARLSRGGAAVSVLARGPALAAIRADGLRTIDDDGETAVRPHAASDDPAALGAQDCVIVSVKAPALPTVAAAIGPLLGPDTAVAFVLNGVPWWFFPPDAPLAGVVAPLLDPGGALARAIGRARTVGGVIYASATIVAPAMVRLEGGPGKLILGEADGLDRARTQALADALDAGGMPVRVGGLRQAVWEKLAGNIATGLPAVLTGRSMADTANDPQGEALIRTLVHETGEIAHALGFAGGRDAEELLARMRGSSHVPSIAQDLFAGRRMEVAAQFAAPLAIAAATGVPTPVLRSLTALVRLRAGALAI